MRFFEGAQQREPGKELASFVVELLEYFGCEVCGEKALCRCSSPREIQRRALERGQSEPDGDGPSAGRVGQKLHSGEVDAQAESFCGAANLEWRQRQIALPDRRACFSSGDPSREGQAHRPTGNQYPPRFRKPVDQCGDRLRARAVIDGVKIVDDDKPISRRGRFKELIASQRRRIVPHVRDAGNRGAHCRGLPRSRSGLYDRDAVVQGGDDCMDAGPCS